MNLRILLTALLTLIPIAAHTTIFDDGKIGGNAFFIRHRGKPAIVTLAHIVMDRSGGALKCGNDEAAHRVIYMPDSSFYDAAPEGRQSLRIPGGRVTSDFTPGLAILLVVLILAVLAFDVGSRMCWPLRITGKALVEQTQQPYVRLYQRLLRTLGAVSRQTASAAGVVKALAASILMIHTEKNRLASAARMISRGDSWLGCDGRICSI